MSEKSQIPHHVAIIPDGNRRWAHSNSLTVCQGHKQGIETSRKIVRHASDRGVRCMSLWGLSVDNLVRRSPREVHDLIKIFHEEFLRLLHDEEIHERKIRIQVFGRWREKFPRRVWKAIEAVERATDQYSAYMLNFFLAYSGTDEMIRAIQQIAADAREHGTRKVTAKMIKGNLFTRDLPPVDLVIRTGGEPHLSNGFMMWDIANAELYFSKKYWPVFEPRDFDIALEDFASRRRKLGS